VRRLLAAAALTAAALVAAAAGAAERRALALYGWADYIDGSVLDGFTAETGIAVTYDSYDRPETAAAALAAGKTGYGLVIIPADLVAGLAARQALAPLAHAAQEKPPADLADRLRVLDPQGLTVPYMWGSLGIGYAPDDVRQRLGEKPVESWDVLFRPENAARLKDCGILLPDRAADVLPAALRFAGAPGDSRNAADYQRAGDALIRMRASVRRLSSADISAALATGDACMALASSADVLQARRRTGEAEEARSIVFVVPREGAPVWFDVFARPADGPDPEAAQAFVAYLSRPDVAARNAVAVGGSPAPEAARAQLPQAMQEDPAVAPGPDVTRRLFAVPAPDAKLQPVIDKIWSRVKAGK
jgi:putrescine transport system substrate-binding protein